MTAPLPGYDTWLEAPYQAAYAPELDCVRIRVVRPVPSSVDPEAVDELLVHVNRYGAELDGRRECVSLTADEAREAEATEADCDCCESSAPDREADE